MQPSGQPSTQPTARPTFDRFLGAWAKTTHDLQFANLVAPVQDNIWVCGVTNERASCIVMVRQSGLVISNYYFVWNSVSAVFQTGDLGRVFLSGQSISQLGTVTSDLADCRIENAQLVCAMKSFYDTAVTAVTFVPNPKKIMYFGTYYKFVSSSLVDAVTGSLQKSYLYSSSMMESLTVLQAPFSGSILNSAELVNAMALEYENPDSFIGGALQLNGDAGMNAYLLRVNSLTGDFKFGVRYHTNRNYVDTRRTLSAVPGPAWSSVTRGILLLNPVLYLIFDSTHESSTSLSVLKVDMETGLIIQQVHVSARNASLSCTDITTTSTGLFLYIACAITERSNKSESIAISVSSDLSFSRLPIGCHKNAEVVYSTEHVDFKKSTLTVSVQTAQSLIVDSEYSTSELIPTVRPTTAPSVAPSAQPSSTPTGEPSSSPTAAPSVSPQPTSQPSSSGPTNTYKPTVKPTQRPSARPSREPTKSPTVMPTITPTARPTLQPSTKPSKQPSVSPTRAPSVTRTRAPTRKPSVSASSASAPPSVATTDSASIVEGGNRTESDVAWVIGGSVVGGLLAIWLGFRLWKWSIYALDQQEKKKAMMKMLQTVNDITDSLQQRTVRETTRRRTARNAAGTGVAGIGRPILSAISEGVLRGVHPDYEESDIENPNIRANTLHKDPFTAHPPLNSVASSRSSSSLELSSLHSSERSEGDEEKQDCSDSSDSSSNYSSSESYSNSISSSWGSNSSNMYSFPSSFSDGADVY